MVVINIQGLTTTARGVTDAYYNFYLPLRCKGDLCLDLWRDDMLWVCRQFRQIPSRVAAVANASYAVKCGNLKQSLQHARDLEVRDAPTTGSTTPRRVLLRCRDSGGPTGKEYGY